MLLKVIFLYSNLTPKLIVSDVFSLPLINLIDRQWLERIFDLRRWFGVIHMSKLNDITHIFHLKKCLWYAKRAMKLKVNLVNVGKFARVYCAILITYTRIKP